MSKEGRIGVGLLKIFGIRASWAEGETCAKT